MPDKHLLYDIEKVYLKRMAALLKNGSIDRDTAKNMVSKFMKLLPFTSMEDLHEKIEVYMKKYPDMDVLQVPIMEKEDKQKAEKVAQEVRATLLA